MKFGILSVQFLPFGVSQEHLFTMEVIDAILMCQKVANLDFLLLKYLCAA